MSGIFNASIFNNAIFNTEDAVVSGGSAPIVGGGVPAAFSSRLHVRTRDDIRLSRARFGISDEAAKVVASVAARQAEALEQDKQKQFEELNRELLLKGIEFDARYLEALSEKRERLIDAEIRIRLQQRLQQLDDEMVVMMLLAAAL